jgi:hypothetical protein
LASGSQIVIQPGEQVGDQIEVLTGLHAGDIIKVIKP